MKRTLYNSPYGSIVLISHIGKLVYCNWDAPDCLQKQLNILETLHIDRNLQGKDNDILKETTRQLDQYFSGQRKVFDLPIDLLGSEFRKKVWNSIMEISYGETVSYKKLAEMSGYHKGVRAVASACGRNPISIIIPCHRVISLNGSLGGYTGGKEKKEALLKLEKEI